MYKVYKLSDGSIRQIQMDNYAEDEFLIASMDFLGTTPNTHEIDISEEVFRKNASSVLGKFLVAEIKYGDASTHTEGELIQGYIPREQDVKFMRDKDGYLRGVVDVVASKAYAPEFCDIFKMGGNRRSVSVEMTVEEDDNGADNGHIVAKSFNILGVTVLGLTVKPSSPNSNMTVKRFSDVSVQNDCEKYYKSVWERFEESLAKRYSVNTDELKETAWGDVDKIELRNAVMDATNRTELVNKVYLKVLEGWEDNPSENLKYPVMELVGNTFYYNRNALASALAYAKQHDEADVVEKVMAIYNKFDLAVNGEGENMSKKNFEDENRTKWREIIAEVQEHEGEKATVESVEDGHIIFTVDDVRYSVKAEMEIDDDGEMIEADIYWDTKEKYADEEDKAETESGKEEEVEAEAEEKELVDEEDKMAEDEPAEEEKPEDEEEMAEDEEKADEEDKSAEDAEMAKDEKIKELEDIIMAKDAEIAELKQYKEEMENAERDLEVQQTLADIKECVDADTFESIKEEGMQCKLASIDAWKNKAKSLAFDANASQPKQRGKWSFAIPKQEEKKPANKWDSIQI